MRNDVVYGAAASGFFVLMIQRPPRSTQAKTLFPYTTLFLSLCLMLLSRGNSGHLREFWELTVPDPQGVYQYVVSDTSICRSSGNRLGGWESGYLLQVSVQRGKLVTSTTLAVLHNGHLC